MRSNALRVLALATTTALLAAGSASAHHSFAMFDTSRTIFIEGVVEEFQWTNPHAEALVRGGPAGQPAKLWTLELTSPGNLLRMGWDKRSLKPGAKVKIELNPLRDGQPGGALRNATLTETGQFLNTRRLADGPLRAEE